MGTSKESQSNVFLGDDVKPHHKNLRNPISHKAIGKWQTGFTVAEIKKIELHISKYLLLLGYQP